MMGRCLKGARFGGLGDLPRHENEATHESGERDVSQELRTGPLVRAQVRRDKSAPIPRDLYNWITFFVRVAEYSRRPFATHR